MKKDSRIRVMASPMRFIRNVRLNRTINSTELNNSVKTNEDYEKERQLNERIYDFYFNKLKFCGCGLPTDTLKFVRDVLNTINDYKNETANKSYKDLAEPYERYQAKLKTIFGFRDDVTEDISSNQNGINQFILYYLDEIGIIEHGSSIGGAWLSNYGKEILKDLNDCEDLGMALSSNSF